MLRKASVAVGGACPAKGGMKSSTAFFFEAFALVNAAEEMQAILLAYKVTPEEILAKKKTLKTPYGESCAGKRSVVNARAELMCLLRDRGCSYPEIGKAFGRDHSTVMYTIKRSYPARNSDVPSPMQAKRLEQRVVRLEREVKELKALVAVLTMREA